MGEYQDNNEKGKEDFTNKVKGDKLWFTFIEIGTEFAIILALPLIGAIFLGKWLNQKYDTKLFLVGLVLFAVVISWYSIIRKVIKIKKYLEK